MLVVRCTAISREDIPFNVKAEDLNAIVVLSFDSLLASVELLSLVHILSAGITSPSSSVNVMKRHQESQ